MVFVNKMFTNKQRILYRLFIHIHNNYKYTYIIYNYVLQKFSRLFFINKGDKIFQCNIYAVILYLICWIIYNIVYD